MTDFFQIDHFGTTSAAEFGICENDTKPYSYLDEGNARMWLAIVKNIDETERRYIPVRNCLTINVQRDEIVQLCDGIIIFTDNLHFIELNNSGDTRMDWVINGVNQLKNTIRIFRNNHNIENYQNRSAYLSNYRKSFFPILVPGIRSAFALEMGIELYIESEIVI